MGLLVTHSLHGTKAKLRLAVAKSVSYTHLDVYKRQVVSPVLMQCCTREVLPSEWPQTAKASLNSCKNCLSSFTSPLERLSEDLFNSSLSLSSNLDISEVLTLHCIIPATQATGVNLPRSVLLCKATAWSKIFATLIGTFPVSSGFTKLLAISMPGVLTTWGSNREHLSLIHIYS